MKTHAPFLKNTVFLCVCTSVLLSMFARAENLTTDKNEMGRLFSQRTERIKLDDLRKNHALRSPQVSLQNNSHTSAVISPTLPKPITLQGYVKRSDGGKNTVWINNKAVQENSTVDDVKIGRLTKGSEISKGKSTSKQVERLEILIPANNKHVQLKAGQRYEPESNRVKEVTTIAKENQLMLEESVEDEATSE